MLQPPVSDLTPWLPGHFLMDDGSAYDAYQMLAAVEQHPQEVTKMLEASRATYQIMEKVMRK